MTKLKIIFFILIILALAYLENTFIINPFNSQLDFLIPRFYNPELKHISQEMTNGVFAPGKVRIISVLIYLIIFALVNAAIICTLAPKKWVKWHFSIYAGISLLFAVVYVIWKIAGHEYLYQLAGLMKDFLCSPVYSLILMFLIYYEKTTTSRESIKP